MQMSIPPSVLTETKQLVHTWLNKKSATRHELQQILGKLFHTGKCCAASRLFVGRMLETLRAAPSQGSIPLSQGFRSDLKWFSEFLPSFNGISLIHTNRDTTHVGVKWDLVTVSLCWESNYCTQPLPPQAHTSMGLASHLQIWAILVAVSLWGGRGRGATRRCSSMSLTQRRCRYSYMAGQETTRY
jgi:hypothetical protein